MIVFNFRRDFLPTVVAGLRPLPAGTGKITAERCCVEIPFGMWQSVMLAEPSQIHIVAIGNA